MSKRTGNPPGRPAYKPTAAVRRQVSIAAGAGMPHEHIALALGITTPTLRKHFERELSVVAYQRRMEALQGLHAAAKRGNVSAAKAYTATPPEFEPLGAASGAPVSTPAPQPKVAPAPQPLAAVGKKEQAAIDATTAQVGTGWEGLLPGVPLQ